MKRVLLGAIATFFFLCESVEAVSWVPIFKSVDGNIFFIDTETLVKKGTISSSWILIENNMPDEYEIMSTKHQVLMDCRNKYFRITRSIYYDQIGRVIEDDTQESFDQITPDSSGENIYKYVCR